MKKLSLAGMFLTGATVAWLATQGCSGSTNPTPTVGGTGAFGVITVGGKQLLYYPNKTVLPSGNGFLSVIDVGQAGNGMAGTNALLTTIDLGSTDQATTTAGNANIVVAAGTNTYSVWFINPSNNTVTKTLQLDPSLNGNEFSGGGGIVTGIAMDEANNRAILSVWDGFIYIDLGSMTMTGGVTSAPSENFGFDGTHELVLNPFYDCGNIPSLPDGGTIDAGFCNAFQAPDGGGTITAGLNVINLKTNTVYTYQNPGAIDPAQPLGSNPDSAAIDPSSEIAAVPPEFEDQENFLDLSQAVYDDPTLSFTAPLIVVPMQEYDGVAVESKTHLAFYEQEGESGIALIDMTQLNDDAGLPPAALVQATMPDTPVTDAGGGGNGWDNLRDPHGIAVTTGLQSNGPVGFVVSDDGAGDLWVARINLQTMLALGPDAGGPSMDPDAGGYMMPLDAGWNLSANDISPAITMFNGAAKE